MLATKIMFRFFDRKLRAKGHQFLASCLNLWLMFVCRTHVTQKNSMKFRPVCFNVALIAAPPFLVDFVMIDVGF